MSKIEIYKSPIAQDRDIDVPEFGGFSPHELQHPRERQLRPDVFGIEARSALYQSAVSRAVHFAYGAGEVPHVHFPNAEHFQHVSFTRNHWLRYGNMEREVGRILFMLEKYPSRRFPVEFDSVCRDVMSNKSVLREWSNQVPRIDRLSRSIYEASAMEMESKKRHDDLGYSNGEKGAFQAEPVFYQSSNESGLLEARLFDPALSEVGSQLKNGDYKNLPAFLHLYNRVKDPISPIRSTLSEQSKIYRELYDYCRHYSPGRVNAESEQTLIVQLALESSFLALPGAKDVFCVVYGGHHELPYIQVDITKFPRGEFAGPKRVCEVLGELVGDAEKIGHPVATPITVSYFQEPQQAKPELFIIDGNNRATAMLLLKFLDSIGFDKQEISEPREALRRFVALHDLDIEWERDIAVALKSLSPDFVDSLQQKSAIIGQFANALMPALLVQEPNFHTVAVAQSQGERIVLLQPMHQAIYNHKRWSIAIPSKQQSHGRAAGNDLRLPLG